MLQYISLEHPYSYIAKPSKIALSIHKVKGSEYKCPIELSYKTLSSMKRDSQFLVNGIHSVSSPCRADR